MSIVSRGRLSFDVGSSPDIGTLSDFEDGRQLGYPANSKYEQVAGHSYRSGKTGGVGVPGGRGAAVDADVGDGLADGWNGLLEGRHVHGAQTLETRARAAAAEWCRGNANGLRASWRKRHEQLPDGLLPGEQSCPGDASGFCDAGAHNHWAAERGHASGRKLCGDGICAILRAALPPSSDSASLTVIRC